MGVAIRSRAARTRLAHCMHCKVQSTAMDKLLVYPDCLMELASYRTSGGTCKSLSMSDNHSSLCIIINILLGTN